MTIKEIKKPRAKSHRGVLAVLQDALIDARENQYSAVLIAMKGKKEDYFAQFIVEGTDLLSIEGLAMKMYKMVDKHDEET